jgi:pantoate--beta-alanine ligase
MRTFDSVSTLRAYVRSSRQDGKTIGFVPTMGALHEGHATLMKRARADCDVVVVSIFVNPTQFGPGEDFGRYPRDLTRDSTLAQQAGVDALFTPVPETIYPAGDRTVVEVGGLGERWEGERRPGHFRGVATVCAKLFQIVGPDRVYFGQKDYQQLKIIERLTADLFFPHVVVPVSTVREKDGLALSSRNAYLNPEERHGARALYRALSAAKERFTLGERNGNALRGEMERIFAEEPRAVLDYAAVVDADTLEPLEQVRDRAVALIAARLGATRLIDNMLLGIDLDSKRQNGPAKG